MSSACNPGVIRNAVVKYSSGTSRFAEAFGCGAVVVFARLEQPVLDNASVLKL